LEHIRVPSKQREGSHQVIVIWGEKTSRGSNPRVSKQLRVIICPGESPGEEEHLAFQLLLVAIQRLQWLTREL